jgi:para-aminobenzoate synthetase / 4-amino-4-deoxychorismate lyase
MATFKPFSDKNLLSLLTGLAAKESFVFLESARVTPENHLSYLFLDPVDRLVCRQEDDPQEFLRQAQDRLDQGFFLAGYIGYEFGYLLEPSLAKSFSPRSGNDAKITLPLADLGVFAKPHIFDHQSQSFTGEKEAWPISDAPVSEQEFVVNNLHLNLGKEEYLEAIHQIKSYIEAGDTYQVNYTLKLRFDFSGSFPAFYNNLRRNQNVSYGGLIKNNNTMILSFSPELFFRKQKDNIYVRPMKGTMLRGRTNIEDRKFADFLHNDIKNRSENVMIVDLLRNDLGRLSRMGGVRVQSLFDVEKYETLFQMTSSIRGELDHPVSLEQMFRALFPCGSVTGAPKIRTMEIIRELEAEDRGVYTGAIGFMSPAGDAVFNVPIRTVVLQNSRGEMGIGSGIVWDSDSVGEWEECWLKGRFLTTPAEEFNLIETMLYHPGSGFWLLDHHLERLAESAHYFSYPLALEDIKKRLNEIAKNFIEENCLTNMRVRLTLSKAGEYEITWSELSGNKLPLTDPMSAMKQAPSNDLPKVTFSDRNSDSGSPFLYHKTTLRKHYDEERGRLVEQAGFFEVLFENEKGEITEGSYTNIFLQKGGKMLTPKVSCGLLPGVLRKYLLQEYPDLVREAILIRTDLEQAEAIFVGNSVRGLVKVKLKIGN